MKKNIGTIDRTIRVLAAAAIAVLYFTGALTGLAAVIVSILAVLFLLTSSISFCPLYVPFKFSTRKGEGAK